MPESSPHVHIDKAALGVGEGPHCVHEVLHCRPVGFSPELLCIHYLRIRVRDRCIVRAEDLLEIDGLCQPTIRLMNFN